MVEAKIPAKNGAPAPPAFIVIFILEVIVASPITFPVVFPTLNTPCPN